MATNTMTTESNVSKAPKLRGSVTSVASAKTATVTVNTLKTHPKYGKKYLVSKKYLVHVPDGVTLSVGDTAMFRECRPMSKRKHHVVIAE